MRLLLFAILFYLFSLESNGQLFDVNVDRDMVKIGEQVQATITVKAPTGSNIELPVFLDTLKAGLEVLESSEIDTISKNDSTTVSQTLLLTSFDSAIYAMPPLVAKINGQQILSNPYLIIFEPVKIDTSQALFDIKGPAKAPFSLVEFLKNYWPFIAIGILLIGLVIWLVLRFTNRPAPVIVEPAMPKIPAHITALERLGKLAQEELWQKGKTKEYYVELSEILRWYIEEHFNIKALEQTTEELMYALRHEPKISSNEKDQIHKMLFLADLVKFAKENPLANENELHFNNIKTFIESHIPTEQDKLEDSDVA